MRKKRDFEVGDYIVVMVSAPIREIGIMNEVFYKGELGKIIGNAHNPDNIRIMFPYTKVKEYRNSKWYIPIKNIRHLRKEDKHLLDEAMVEEL